MSQNVFFTSDEHYEHANIIKFCKRPFENVYDMREGLIARHNAKVKKEDITYHLGDTFWRHCTLNLAEDILRRLNGNHYLILGNHDEVAEKLSAAEHRKKFVWVKDVALVKPRAQFPALWLSHYAHRTWPASHKGSYHLFGHTHAVLSDYRYSMDIGVDNCNYEPLSLEEIDAHMKAKGELPPDEIQQDMKNNPWVPEVSVAQLAQQSTCNAPFVGSTPTAGSKFDWIDLARMRDLLSGGC
jgi:calcineurin-like phosphoesterase family protein